MLRPRDLCVGMLSSAWSHDSGSVGEQLARNQKQKFSADSRTTASVSGCCRSTCMTFAAVECRSTLTTSSSSRGCGVGGGDSGGGGGGGRKRGWLGSRSGSGKSRWWRQWLRQKRWLCMLPPYNNCVSTLIVPLMALQDTLQKPLSYALKQPLSYP